MIEKPIILFPPLAVALIGLLQSLKSTCVNFMVRHRLKRRSVIVAPCVILIVLILGGPAFGILFNIWTGHYLCAIEFSLILFFTLIVSIAPVAVTLAALLIRPEDLIPDKIPSKYR